MLKVSRKKLALAAVATAAAVVAIILLSSGSGAVQPFPSLQLILVDSAPPPALPTPSLPALRGASGWPFQQLPMIAKFDVVEPRIVAMPSVRPVFIDPAPLRVVPLESDPASALWLLPPLAVGAAYGGVHQDVPDATLPEPSTLLLLATGLALGLGARRRRR